MSLFSFIFTKMLNPPWHAAREQIGEAGKIGRCDFAFEVRTAEFLDTAILIDDPTYVAVEHRELFVRFSKLDVLLVLALSHAPFFEQPAQSACLYSTANIDVLDALKSLWFSQRARPASQNFAFFRAGQRALRIVKSSCYCGSVEALRQEQRVTKRLITGHCRV